MKTNWKNLEEVKKLAISFGPNMVVFKHKDRPNYNITHGERWDRVYYNDPNIQLIHRT